MKKPKLQNYYVDLFVLVENFDKTISYGVLSFDTYSENKYNAVLDVMKYINLDVIKNERANQVNFNDEFTWYNAVDYSVIRVVSVKEII